MAHEATRKRRYELKARAESQRETRRRITEAAVELHGTVGPARMTISELAKRAGVERVTIYRHFPDEAALFEACSAHWQERNPMPDPAAWRGLEPPEERLRAALTALYAHYAEAEPMLTNVTRDAETMPALAAVGEPRRRRLAEIEEELLEGRPEGARPMLAVALDFRTWRLLVRAGGVEPADLVVLMVRAVGCAPGGG